MVTPLLSTPCLMVGAWKVGVPGCDSILEYFV